MVTSTSYIIKLWWDICDPPSDQVYLTNINKKVRKHILNSILTPAQMKLKCKALCISDNSCL